MFTVLDVLMFRTLQIDLTLGTETCMILTILYLGWKSKKSKNTGKYFLNFLKKIVENNM